MTRTHSRIVPHWTRISMSTGDAHQSTPTQLTGLVLILSHSLRYTGYEAKKTSTGICFSTTRLETEIIRITDLISILIAPAPKQTYGICLSCQATHHPRHFFGFIRCMWTTHFKKWVGAAFGSKTTLTDIWLGQTTSNKQSSNMYAGGCDKDE